MEGGEKVRRVGTELLRRRYGGRMVDRWGAVGRL
jgi:hypothetical protein